MGLFKRKDPDFIDLGDQVAVSSEKADEMARTAMEQIVERYDDPVAGEIDDALMDAVKERYPELRGKVGSLLASTAKLGYAARMYEEDFESVQSKVPVLTDALQQRLESDEPLAEAIKGVALSLAEYSADDPSSPRSLDAIDGIGGLREPIAQKAVIASANVARNMGLTTGDELFPEQIDAADVLVAWRIGFLVRSCEASLPQGVELSPDEKARTITIDIWALEDAVNSWIEDNPGASDDEIQEVYRELAPRFQVDQADMAEVPDDEPRYAFISIDQSGRIVSQRDQDQL